MLGTIMAGSKGSVMAFFMGRDIRMPGIDGPQLYERAVAMDPSYSSRFLFMSGDLVRDSTQGFVSSLNCPCLAKPFALQVLYQNLEPHLDQNSSAPVAPLTKTDRVGMARPNGNGSGF